MYLLYLRQPVFNISHDRVVMRVYVVRVVVSGTYGPLQLQITPTQPFSAIADGV